MSSEKNPRVNRLKLLPAQREVLRDMIEETRCQIAFLEGQASILSEQADAMLSARSENNGE